MIRDFVYNASVGNNWAGVLIEVVRSTPKDQKEVLYLCGDKFFTAKEDAYAKETYLRLNDVNKLMSLYTSRQMWEEAAKLADEYDGNFDPEVMIIFRLFYIFVVEQH